MVFIDGDKENVDLYYELSLKLVRTGGAVLVDNTLWFGRPPRKDIFDAETVAIRALNEKIHSDCRIDISLVPFADGVTICLKK